MRHAPHQGDRCISRATRGRYSQMGRRARVAIGLNSPRISAGASGFMSKVSIWLGPPYQKMRMQERIDGTVAVGDLLAAPARHKPPRLRPK